MRPDAIVLSSHILNLFAYRFTQVSGSIGGTRLILSVRSTALKPHSASIAETEEPSAGIEMRIGISPRKPARRHRSFHVTQGPSFGNIDGLGDDELDMHDDDTDYGLSPISETNLISPIDYGRSARSLASSRVQVDDKWATVSGRQNGLSKAMDVLRSMP
jgi:hypothetical protein